MNCPWVFKQQFIEGLTLGELTKSRQEWSWSQDRQDPADSWEEWERERGQKERNQLAV